jgi:hypothetical protein
MKKELEILLCSKKKLKEVLNIRGNKMKIILISIPDVQ